VNRFLKLAPPLLFAVAAAACNAGGSSTVPSAAGQSVADTHSIPQWQATGAAHRACPAARPGWEECDLLVQAKTMGPAVAGWGPADFQAAYNLPSATKGKGVVVAIVDAFDNPNVASDLAVYRSNFGLGTANFFKYNQEGQQGHYPKGDPGWGGEIDLDVQMVSAVCPNCTIYLFEAKTNSSRNLYATEKEAQSMGATIISNSWGGGGGNPSRDAFNTPGIVYLASAGDGGYGMQDPADFPNVVSVGGTLLSKASSTYSERTWPDTGCGCSKVNKPSWQHDPDCKKRTGNDVSAVAMGVASYDSYPSGGWGTVGGTSVSSPMIGGIFGLANNSSKQDGGRNFWKLSKKKLAKDLHAITEGGVMGCPSSLESTYLCMAGTGQFGQYSGPAGWGTPNGIGAF
jgi:Subtilase family